MDAERDRVLSFNRNAPNLESVTPWYLWGPYVSERAWGTVREHYSNTVSPWAYLPHEAARSRAYRWNEDGMGAVCDVHQRLCLGLSLWNGQDDFLKERMFGLTGEQGNHGEDVKEYYWYVDALPSHAWLRWRYHYPHEKFPYGSLRDVNRQRRERENRGGFEYELLDTGVFDVFGQKRYWIVEVTYAKADPTDLLMRIVVRNAGPEPRTLHVLPTLWFRNTWSWEPNADRPELRADVNAIVVAHPDLGNYRLHVGDGPAGSRRSLLFCENETSTTYPKDGINNRVVHKSNDTVNPEHVGTKAAVWYEELQVPGHGSVELRLRLRADDGRDNSEVGDLLYDGFEETMTKRQKEADEFYAELAPTGSNDDEKLVMRQAYAGMIWSKQFYSYDVARWLDGDASTQPRPPTARKDVKDSNAGWRHFNAADVISMPDAWEFPWFAAWDLAFQAVVLAHIDPAFAKHQLELLCREWYQHPNGALPAFEWAFDDANPPVHAWAALKVWRLDGSDDYAFLLRIFLKLLLNFTWWVNRQDVDGNNVFEGGFLGLDNISVLNRSKLPPGRILEQSDATGWMAFYCLSMLEIARLLAEKYPALGFEELVTKFLEHFARLSLAIDKERLWDESDKFFYDRIRKDGERESLRVRSLVGVVPVFATALITKDAADRAEALGKAFSELHERRREERDPVLGIGRLLPLSEDGDEDSKPLVSMVSEQQLAGMCRHLLDEDKLLSKHGVRSLSREYLGKPYVVELDGVRRSIDYRPAESPDGEFGGNSNWRGPVWMPLNYLLITLAEFGERFGDTLTVEYPTRSGKHVTLLEVAADLRRRLIELFLRGDDGRRPCFGGVKELQEDAQWSGNLLFFEYFHGDNGAGLGASHQTGWTGLIADLICGLRGVARPPGECRDWSA